MNRRSYKTLLVGAVVALCLTAAVSQADAAYGWAGYQTASWGCCYTPSYTPCCTTVSYCNPCYSGGWYLGWRPGPVRRLLLGPYRWYWGGSCGSYCGYSVVGTSYDCCGSVDGNTLTATPDAKLSPTPAKKPVEPAMPSDAPDAPTPAPMTEPTPAAPNPEPAMPKTTGTTIEETGILTVWVPYDAKVTVNGLETRSTGSRRQFVSYGLKPGLSYKYEVKAQIARDGQLQEETRTVSLTAGVITAVAFGFNVSPAQQVAASK